MVVLPGVGRGGGRINRVHKVGFHCSYYVAFLGKTLDS